MLHRGRGRWWYADLIEAVRDEYDRLGRLSWDDDGISLEKRTAWRQRLGCGWVGLPPRTPHLEGVTGG